MKEDVAKYDFRSFDHFPLVQKSCLQGPWAWEQGEAGAEAGRSWGSLGSLTTHSLYDDNTHDVMSQTK